MNLSSLQRALRSLLHSSGVDFLIDPNGSLRVPAEHEYVGDLVVAFDNDEITVFIGKHTHCHFTLGICGDPEHPNQLEACASAAAAYVRDVLADKFIIWNAGEGHGGSYHVDHVPDLPTKAATLFTWSGFLAR